MALLATDSSSPRSRLKTLLRRHRWFLLVVLGFSGAVVPTLRDGVGALDAHYTLQIVQILVDQHQLLPTREPGHPGNLYFLGSVAWLLRHGFDRELGDVVYSTLQWLTALLTATAFYAWLLRRGISHARAAVGVLCLVCSPQFLVQAIDGEEILHGLLFLLAGLFVLGGSRSPPYSAGRLASAIVLFAIATTFRAEYVLAATILGTAHLLHARAPWKTWLAAIAGTFAVLVVLWLPILLTQGLHKADSAMNFTQALLAWGYKLLFVCFGFPTSLLLLFVVVLAARRAASFRWRELSASDVAVVTALLISAAHVALYLTLPHKPGGVLIAVPFLLFLVLRERAALIGAVTACSVLGVFVGVDLFRDRVFAGPRFVEGGYRYAISGKPGQLTDYVHALAATPTTGKSVIIGDAWSWVILFHQRRGGLAAQPLPVRGVGRGFALDEKNQRLLYGREFAERIPALEQLHRNGYEIVIDRSVWRTLYARYDTSSQFGDSAMIGRVPVRLATVGDPSELADKTQR